MASPALGEEQEGHFLLLALLSTIKEEGKQEQRGEVKEVN